MCIGPISWRPASYRQSADQPCGQKYPHGLLYPPDHDMPWSTSIMGTTTCLYNLIYADDHDYLTQHPVSHRSDSARLIKITTIAYHRPSHTTNEHQWTIEGIKQEGESKGNPRGTQGEAVSAKWFEKLQLGDRSWMCSWVIPVGSHRDEADPKAMLDREQLAAAPRGLCISTWGFSSSSPKSSRISDQLNQQFIRKCDATPWQGSDTTSMRRSLPSLQPSVRWLITPNTGSSMGGSKPGGQRFTLMTPNLEGAHFQVSSCRTTDSDSAFGSQTSLMACFQHFCNSVWWVAMIVG